MGDILLKALMILIIKTLHKLTMQHYLETEQFTNTKKCMQHMLEKDASIRAEINVVLSAMQFSEIIRQHLEGLKKPLT